MARHRAVRSMNIDDELDEDDDYHYGHSLEENYCISPATAAQFTFNRDAHTMASYMAEPDIPEVENEVEEDENPLESSTGNLRKQLNDIDIARLNSCLEEIHNILGETASEQMITEVVLRKKFDVESSLNELLSQQAQEAPKPQRAPRQKRNRSQGDSDSDSDSDVNISPEITEISQNDKSKQKIPFFRTHSSEKIVSHTCNGFIAKCDPGLLDSLAKQKNQVNDKNHLKTVSLSELVEKNKQINSLFNQKNLSKVASETTVPLSKLADQNRQSIKTGDATKLSVNLKPQTCGQTKFGHKDSESICLSLSELANRHNAQSAAFSRTSLIVEASKVQQFAAASSNEITKSDGPSCRIGESKNVLTRNNFDKKEKNSPSLADLAKLNLSSVNFNNGNIKSANYSLADLAKRHKSVANVADTPKPKVELSTLLLSDLAKTHKRKEVLSEPLNTAQKKSVSDKKSKLSTENKSKLKSVEQPLPCNHSIITFHRVMACKSLSDLNNQNPSMFGKALSLRYFKSDKRNSCSRFLKYSFKSQTHGQTDPLVSTLQHVTAFDFSTPSPDDIILLRQKEAYKRNGNEI